MQTKYCIMPDEEKFFAFLSAQSFTESELLQLRLMHINQICVDESPPTAATAPSEREP